MLRSAIRSVTVRERTHIAVVVVSAVFVGLAYSLLLPLFISPDEPAHLDGVRHMVVEGGFLTGGTALMSNETVSAERQLQTLGPLKPGVPFRRFLAEDATPRPERPSFHDLGTMDLGISPGHMPPNYIANHPPTYYIMTGVVSRVAMAFLPEGAWSFDREILLMRWISVLLLAGTTALTYPLAKVVGLGHRGALVAMTLPLGIPQYVHIGSSVNNDNLYVFAGTAFVLATLLLVRPNPENRLNPSAALATGLTATLVVLSKAQGLVALFVVAGLLIWIWRSRRVDKWPAALRLALPPAVMTGTYFLVNLLRTGTFIPRETTSPIAVPTPPDILAWVKEYANIGSRTFWGAFGWLDAAIPPMLPRVLSAVVLCLVTGSLVSAWITRKRWLLVPWTFGALAVGLPVYASLAANLNGGGMRAMQGRYAYPVVPLAACTIILALRPLVRHHRSIAVLMAVAVSLVILRLQQMAVEVILSRHWGPSDGTVGGSFHALAAWSPLPYAATAAVGLLGVGAMCVVAAVPTVATVSAVREAGPDAPDDNDGKFDNNRGSVADGNDPVPMASA